jgi:hypothetical protein
MDKLIQNSMIILFLITFECTLSASFEQYDSFPNRTFDIKNITYNIKQDERIDSIISIKSINEILLNLKILVNNVYKTREENTLSNYQNAIKELDDFRENRYYPTLEKISEYVNIHKDTSVLNVMLRSLWVDRGSASEMPSFVISDLFVKQTELVIGQIIKTNNSEQIKFYYDEIDWGLKNLFTKSDGLTYKNEYYSFKKHLDRILKKINP